MISWLLIVGIVIASIAWLVTWRARRSPGLKVLEERYARGEINRDEYLEKRRDIAG